VTTGRPAESEDRAENFYEPPIHDLLGGCPPHRTFEHCAALLQDATQKPIVWGDATLRSGTPNTGPNFKFPVSISAVLYPLGAGIILLNFSTPVYKM